MFHPQSPDDTPLSGLEARLAALAPRATIDRDRVMFAAGRRAAAQRLRRANRVLAATNVLLGGLLAIVLVPGWMREPVAAPAPTIDRPRLAEDDRSTAMPRTTADASLALVDGPTNFRLLQLLSGDPDAQIDKPTQRTVPRQIEHPSPERLSPRALLNRYLNEKQEQM
jgi:hypothetical protein